MKRVLAAALGALSVLSAHSPAFADATETYAINGLFADGSVLSGSLDIDLLSGLVESADVAVSGKFQFSGPLKQQIDGYSDFSEIDVGPLPNQGVQLILDGLTSNLYGSSATLASLDAPAVGPAPFYLDGPFYTTYFDQNTASVLTDGTISPAVSAAPEPSAWLLLLLGVGGIGLALRHSRWRHLPSEAAPSRT